MDPARRQHRPLRAGIASAIALSIGALLMPQAVSAGVAPTNDVLPAITGMPTVGELLTATPGTWTGGTTTPTYQWQRCNASGTTCSAISGATATTYRLAEGDAGSSFKVAETVGNVDGSTTATSLATDPAVFISRQYEVDVPEGDNGYFGAVTSISGDSMAVSSRAFSGQGAVFVYVRSGTSWTLQQAIPNPFPDYSDLFGEALSLSGDTLVIGAPFEDSSQTGVGSVTLKDNDALNSGAVFVYVRTRGVWSPQAYLKASDAEAGDRFGLSVAVQGDTAIVGAPFASAEAGAAYVFTRAGTTWTQQALLTAGTPRAGAHFGGAVKADLDTAVVGAPDDEGYGAAYVYFRSSGAWSQQAVLQQPSRTAQSVFGAAVDIVGDRALIGAPLEYVGGRNEAGAAHLFVRASGLWSLATSLTPANLDGADNFGSAVGLGTDLLVVGARAEDSSATGVNGGDPSDNTVESSGAAYMYVKTLAGWDLRAYIKPTTSAPSLFFGSTVSLSGTSLAIGNLASIVPVYIVSTTTVASPPLPKAAPTVSGGTVTGDLLTSTNGDWWYSPTTYSYRWQRCDINVAFCTDTTGTSASYTASVEDVGYRLRVMVTASNSRGSASAASAPTTVVTLGNVPVVSAIPTFTGTPRAGSLLRGDPGTWAPTPTSYAYQWLWCDAEGANCRTITKATKSTYRLPGNAYGYTVKLRVRALNAAGYGEAFSLQSPVIRPPL